MPNIRGISYASRSFIRRQKQITDDAIKSKLFTSFYCYAETDIDTAFIEKLGDLWKYGRGGGWWIWKPYIIWKELQKMGDNDVLVYLDSGCTINVSTDEARTRFNEYVDMTQKSECGMLRFSLSYEEWEYTNNFTFQYFKLLFPEEFNKKDIRHMKINVGGIIFLRKTQFTIKFFDIMMKIINETPQLFSEVYTRQGENHRHDQSIMSILYNIMGGDLIIEDETYFNNGDFSTEYAKKFPIWATRSK